MASRRQVIKGALATSLVAFSGVSIWQLSLSESQETVEADDYAYQFLTLDDRYVLFAIVPALLGSAFDSSNPKEKLINLIQQIDQAIDFVARSSQDELRQLFDLLGNQLGKAYLAGVWNSWSDAKPQALSDFLNEWRTSFIELFRAGYFGLHQIVFGTFYAQPESWGAIDYPGPPRLNLSEEFYKQFD